MQTLQQLQAGELIGATSLTLSESLTEFPQEIYTLADTLEYLDLSKNNLSALPADLGRLTKLKILFCSQNKLTSLPASLGNLPLLDIAGFKANQISEIPSEAVNPNLRWLILTDNQLNELPSTIGNCNRMQKLMLAGNQLTTLPPELSRCRNLALLRISANRLTQLPKWLLTMPKLSWLAFSGNLFNRKPPVPPAQLIQWDDLEIEQLLGEGASGHIYKAKHQIPSGSVAAAIKVFKGAVTSDGLPEDEIDICITAGKHPGLVHVIGQVDGHPDNRKGLLMDLIPSHFYNLGLPPSLESCTRDVFKPGQALSVAEVPKIASTIASVAAQLHSKGIMHSDLYAHNILVDDEGNTLFGDFGAACFYDRNDAETAPALERLEVNAYGQLLDDLIGLCNDLTHPAIEKLKALRDECIGADVLARPGFEQISKNLEAL
ncbi:leucine-rich repeat-containing protein kinase family protein [Mucilaginibacter myungsuensis]|uniref:Serine/threonine-protein kinase n=1 Tax=Mucilaginibacter myungsuensis TaxID=649104 RepID=A0A929KV95_9SPHI|nr:leucine-rich repeat-containing protein kinase family protein [Mucilaginibacter myungsuensis]MBE9661090.1 serine/threonine-protein kinase [Mucilaginibacter myungsuensis]MDN3597234.1 leucine-rich repeat-containing protein kinase family protein [Mucilaginibacter myungsuensis]